LLVNLSGLVDVDVELQRLTKEADRIKPLLMNLKKKTESSNYESQVRLSSLITNHACREVFVLESMILYLPIDTHVQFRLISLLLVL
jgi:hypothetical protein